MKEWITGKIIFWITNNRGFTLWIQHQSSLETINLLLEYRLYCKAHDEEQSIEDFTEYIKAKVLG